MPRRYRRIIAPVSDVEDTQRLIDEGADELYCGYLPNEWIKIFGEADVFSRRQGRSSNIGALEQLDAIIKCAQKADVPVHLALNSKYSRFQELYLSEILKQFEDMGGSAVITSDLGLILELNNRKSPLKTHLSTMAGVFNCASINFFIEQGVSRVVLPRELTIQEIKKLCSSMPDVSFEVICMLQRCQFMDSWCGFYHGVKLHSTHPCAFEYENQTSGLSIAWSHDPAFEGHGCQLHWVAKGVPISNLATNDFILPSCSACFLSELLSSNAHYFKVAGRGFPNEIIIKSVRFMRSVLDAILDDHKGNGCAIDIVELYMNTFGTKCTPERCYYRIK